MRKKSSLLMLMLFCSLWLACETKPTPPANPTTSASPSPTGTTPAPAANDAKALYVQNCASCHGENGIAPNEALRATNLTEATLQDKWTEDHLKDVILKGFGRMSAVRGVSPEDATKIAQHVKTLKK